MLLVDAVAIVLAVAFSSSANSRARHVFSAVCTSADWNSFRQWLPRMLRSHKCTLQGPGPVANAPPPTRSSVNGRPAVFTVNVSGHIGHQSHATPRSWEYVMPS